MSGTAIANMSHGMMLQGIMRPSPIPSSRPRNSLLAAFAALLLAGNILFACGSTDSLGLSGSDADTETSSSASDSSSSDSGGGSDGGE